MRAVAVRDDDEVGEVLREHAPLLLAALPFLLDALALRDVEERHDRAVERAARRRGPARRERRPTRPHPSGLRTPSVTGPAALPVVSTRATGYSAAGKGEPSSRIVSGSKSADEALRQRVEAKAENAQRVGVRTANRAIPRRRGRRRPARHRGCAERALHPREASGCGSRAPPMTSSGRSRDRGSRRAACHGPRSRDRSRSRAAPCAPRPS